MTVVTVSTYRSTHVATRDSFGMDAFSIREHGAIADAAPLHERFVSMTSAACLRDRRPVYGGVWIAGREHCREIAILCVAITASRGFRAIVNSLGVETAIVVCVNAGVKL